MKTAPTPLTVARTQGSSIELADGAVLTDGISSWWTACHGYNHPHICQAIAAQLTSVPHVMLGGLVHEPARKLAHRLAVLTPGDLNHSFFSESGSVAVEIAMKMAIQFWRNQDNYQRSQFVSFEHGYHGDTFAAMSVCDPVEGMHSKFAGVLAKQLIVKLPADAADFVEFESAVAHHQSRLAGLIIEPLVQAAGGFRFHTPETLRRIVEIARRHGLLVIFDEIATGFGRTGSMFASEQGDVVPDIMTLSKALTGGTLPLAVTIAREHVFSAFWSDDFDLALMHGPTFCGNALACAAANASLDLFETEPRFEQVAAIEDQLCNQLEACRSMPVVRDVRVKGAIGVVELAEPLNVDELRRRFVDRQAWIRPFGRVVYLMPALTIRSEELKTLTTAIVDVLRSSC